MGTTKTGKRPRRYLRSRITRKLILDTALQVFLSEGYAKSTIARISEEASVGYGTVYSHFKGKDDILNKVVDGVLDEFYALLDIEFVPASYNEAKEIYYKIMATAFSLAEQHRPILKVYMEALGQSNRIKEHWEAVLAYFIKSTAKSIRFAQEKGMARQYDSFVGAKAYILLVDQFLWEVVNENEIDDLEKLSEVLTDLLFQGFFTNPDSGN